MTADRPDDFPYERAAEASAQAREGYWRIAKGLQAADGLSTSDFLDEIAEGHTAGKYTAEQAKDELAAYYARRKASEHADLLVIERQEEADLVSLRIAELLESGAFMLAPSILLHIHRHLFQDLDANTYKPGSFKTEALVKSERVLNGDSVLYADPSLVDNSLDYLFEKESGYAYGANFDADALEHFSQFIAHIWQVHPFVEGNTRTVAAFASLYLNSLGFDIADEPFEENSEYFRNALVRANYRNAKAQIVPDLGYLVAFFDNLVAGGSNPLNPADLTCQTLYDDSHLLRNVSVSKAIKP